MFQRGQPDPALLCLTLYACQRSLPSCCKEPQRPFQCLHWQRIWCPPTKKPRPEETKKIKSSHTHNEVEQIHQSKQVQRREVLWSNLLSQILLESSLLPTEKGNRRTMGKISPLLSGQWCSHRKTSPLSTSCSGSEASCLNNDPRISTFCIVLWPLLSASGQ